MYLSVMQCTMYVMCYACSAPLYCDITETLFRVDEDGAELEEPTVKVLLQPLEQSSAAQDVLLPVLLL
jgi:hypothetical protein